jgi:hypothetical protein
MLSQRARNWISARVCTHSSGITVPKEHDSEFNKRERGTERGMGGETKRWRERERGRERGRRETIVERNALHIFVFLRAINIFFLLFFEQRILHFHFAQVQAFM